MTKFAVGAATHVGQVRQVNQDNILRADDVFAVADGMGGHRGGEVASLVAVQALQENFIERTTDSLVIAVQLANQAIVERAKGDPDLRGMGTTMCALARVHLDDGEEILTVVNVGDSRAYLLKSGNPELIQISEDHSLVQTLVRQGQLTPDEAAVHPQRNILTRALGIDQKVLPDSFDLLPVRGDRYLLCSDGLFNEVDEIRIAEVLSVLSDPQAAAEELVRLANEGGGRDNISVVVVDILDDAGHNVELEEQSDDHRVVHVVHGPERAGTPSEEEMLRPPAPKGGRGSKHAAPVTVLAGPGPGPGAGAPPPSALHAAPKSQFTWRVGVFLLVFAGIFVVAIVAIQWVATNSYYVGFEGDKVAIYQGRPGGFLWYEPSVKELTTVSATDVPSEFRNDVAQGKAEPSLEEAQAFVNSFKSSPPPSSSTTTTTGTSRPATTSGGLGGAITDPDELEPTTIPSPIS